MSGGSLCAEQFEADLTKAAETFDVIRSTDTSLLIDLDTPEALAQYERVIPKLVDNFGIASSQSWLSKSGNTHVLIELRDALPASVRLALQAALGSDGVRELLGIKRMLNGVPQPSALFKPRRLG